MTGTVSCDSYVAGWLNSSVDGFLRTVPRDFGNAQYALITCLDSNSDPASLLEGNAALRTVLNGATTVKRGLLLPANTLRKATVRSQLFFGFDEVWFFPTPEISAKPSSVSIVGPNRIDQATLDKLVRWMDLNGCSLALGDGVGLNVIVRAFGLAKHVIANSLSQPSPTFQMSDLWVQDEEKTAARKTPRKRRAVTKART